MGRVGHVPQPHRVVAAAGGQGVPVRAERHRVDGVGVAGQRWAERGGVGRVSHVPQPHRVIGAAGGQGAPVGTERHRVDRVGVAGQGWPSGLGWAGSVTFHNRTVWSALPVARVCPSGLNATE